MENTSMESKYLTIQGKKLRYKSYVEKKDSEKPICIFIHGASPESQHTEFWNPILPIILKHCQPILLDGYGHGQSDKPRSDEHLNFEIILKIYIDYLQAILKEEGINSCTFIGRSLGGAITHTVSKKFDTYLTGIGLIAPSGAGRTNETLQSFTKKVSVLWDSQDPAVGYQSYRTIESTVKQVKLFVIGANKTVKATRNQERRQNLKPSHVPELQYPALFEEFLVSLTN